MSTTDEMKKTVWGEIPCMIISDILWEVPIKTYQATCL